TALMTGQAYLQSARIAERMGPFAGYEKNREPMLEVIGMHRDSLRPIKPENVPAPLLRAGQDAWDKALAEGTKSGYRNSQVSVLAPTGTIGFMMDCDTTGIEPDLALVKYKKLVGGGMIKIVNNTVPQALSHLGYQPEEVSAIVDFIDKTGTIEGAPALKTEHLPVFDCSLSPSAGSRSISWTGHVRMMAAAQPFLSGAISKTINMPESSTVEDVMQAYVESWKLGLKAVAVYRDNSKRSQPLSASHGKKEERPAAPAPAAPAAAAVAPVAMVPAPVAAAPAPPAQHDLFPGTRRRKLPETRNSVTHKFSIASHQGYITVGMYDDGAPGEIFIKMSKEGSTLSGFMDGFAMAVSIGLQYGVPLKSLVDKFINTRFDPSGYTPNHDIRYAKSVLDYIGRWLGGKFISRDYLTSALPAEAGENGAAVAAAPGSAMTESLSAPGASPSAEDAPTCSNCGSLMTRNGSCYKCGNCGETSGCS
ncbi:MAG TPA: hypothetical protein VJW51_04715, partial [Candidatus Acidoferrales bacterium]|nr:hypothetical protein [Candidatus Acidoferrales bacterium]